jgi:Ca-activated chloride channel family protein
VDLLRRRTGRGSWFWFPDAIPLLAARPTLASRLAPRRPLVRCAALVLLGVALARPQAGHKEEEILSEGIDIVVALDISGSMRAQDFRPDDRLGVARKVVAQFITGRRSDRIGLVTFSRIAATRCPLTLDYPALEAVVEAIEFAPAEDDGTAIGMGLATALARLKGAKGRSRVVVLLTDGINNSGTVDPLTGADLAASLGVRVHTVGVGSEGRVPLPLPDGRVVRADLPLDEAGLREIARRTGGDYFRATDPAGLRRIFARIDEMEKTKVQVRTYARYSDLFPHFLAAAGVLLLLEAGAWLTRLRALP